MSAPQAIDELAIDPESPGLFDRADYFELLARLRAEAPVFEYAPNRWVVSRHADVRDVSRDPGRFCSGEGVLMNDPKRDGSELPGSILHMDPPEHAAWRRVASRWFTPRAVAALSDAVDAVVRRQFDQVAAGESIDLVDSLAAPIAVMAIAETLGLGDVDTADFRRWSDACIVTPEVADEAAALETMATIGELLELLGTHIADRRRRPADDLLSVLVQAEVDGRPLDDGELVMYCLALVVAGNETSRHLMSGSAVALFEHPDQRAELAASPGRLPQAVEECLRWVTPIQSFARTATGPTELAGRHIERGDWLVLLYASANRDEAAFGPSAGRFDVTREPNPAHLAFGFGEHLCLGASLARLEARAFLAELLARHPDYQVDGEGIWTRSTLVRGYASLPVAL